MIEDALRRRGPNAGNKMHQPKSRDAVARVLDEAEHRQHILDMRGIEKFEPAELHERDISPGQFDLERAAVMRRAEQYRLLLEDGPGLAALEHPLDNVAGLVGLIAHRYQLWPGGGCSLGPEVLGEAFTGKLDDAIGGGKNGLRRTVVPIQRDNRGRRIELAGEVENMAHGGRAKRIDRLGVVTDHGETPAARFQSQQNRGLQAVRILVLIDQDMVEATADVFR